MRKYLSLGGAMMMGSVIGKSDKSLLPAKYELQPAQVLGMPTEHTQAAQFNFAHAKPIPQPEPTIQKGRRYEVEEDVITSHCTSHDNQRVNNRRDYEERSLTTSNGTVSLGESVDSPDTQPQNVKLTVDIYCGAYVQAVPGYQFYCYDYLTGLYHYCIGRNDWWYQCWDGQEWEWGNFLEADGTPDNSLLTSLDTDYMAGTSASILVENEYSPFEVEQRARPARRQNCYYDNQRRRICWDGQEWEWANIYERDGTPDNSPLTSLDTDHLPGTSASIVVEYENNYYSPLSVEVEGMAHGPAIEEVSVVTSCDEIAVEDAGDLWDETQSVEDNFGYYGQSKLVNVNRHHDDWNNDWESNKRNIHGEDDYEVRHSHNHH